MYDSQERRNSPWLPQNGSGPKNMSRWTVGPIVVDPPYQNTFLGGVVGQRSGLCSPLDIRTTAPCAPSKETTNITTTLLFRR